MMRSSQRESLCNPLPPKAPRECGLSGPSKDTCRSKSQAFRQRRSDSRHAPLSVLLVGERACLCAEQIDARSMTQGMLDELVIRQDGSVRRPRRRTGSRGRRARRSPPALGRSPRRGGGRSARDQLDRLLDRGIAGNCDHVCAAGDVCSLGGSLWRKVSFHSAPPGDRAVDRQRPIHPRIASRATVRPADAVRTSVTCEAPIAQVRPGAQARAGPPQPARCGILRPPRPAWRDFDMSSWRKMPSTGAL